MFLEFFSWSLSSFLILCFVLLGIYTAHMLIVKPYLILHSFAKQGGKIKFSPGLGMILTCNRDAVEKGDFFYYFKSCVEANPNVKTISVSYGSNVMTMLVQPYIIREFYTCQEKYYKKDIPTFTLLREIMKEGLILGNGETHRKNRKIISSVFHYEFLRQMIPVIVETTDQFFDKWVSENALKGVNVLAEFEKLTGEIVGRIFFGSSFNENTYDGKSLTVILAELMLELYNTTFSFWRVVFGFNFIKMGLLPQHRRFIRKLRKMRAECENIVKQRRASFDREKVKNQQRKDLLDALFEAQENNKFKLDDDEIVDDFIALFLAGIDSVHRSLTMTLWYLSRYPEYKQNVELEAEMVFKNPKSIQHEDLNEMKFTSAFFKESLRFAPPGALLMPRTATQDHMLGDLLVKKGSVINICVVALGVNEKYFKNARQFDPNRWMDKSMEENLDPFAYLPFSAGSRNCIGQHLAVMESKIILAIFLKKFNYKVPEDYQMKIGFTSFLEPLERMKLDLELK